MGKQHGGHTPLPLLVVLALLVAVAVPATAHEDSDRVALGTDGAPSALEHVVDLGPHRVLRQVGDGYEPRADLAAENHDAARLLADNLNRNVQQGLWEVDDNFHVTVLDKGRQNILETYGSVTCFEITDGEITADWSGFHFDMQPTCTEAEMQAALADQHARVARAADGEETIAPARLGQNHSNPNGVTNGNRWGCGLSVALLSLSLIGLAITVALLPTPVSPLAWIGLGTMWVTTLFAFLDFIDNCTSVRALRGTRFGSSAGGAVPVRTPMLHYYSYCHYGGSSNWVWDSRAYTYVPRNIKFNCG